MIAGSFCILDERAREVEYLTKAPLVPDAHEAVELKKCFLKKKEKLKKLKEL